jgi:hypothetical protein
MTFRTHAIHAAGAIPRYSLAAILVLSTMARRDGDRSYSAIATCGHGDGQKLTRALGLMHVKTPCVAPLYYSSAPTGWEPGGVR